MKGQKVRPLKVAINADLTPGTGAGGIESVLAGLIHGLGCLDDDDVEYTIVCTQDGEEWAKSYIGAHQRVACCPTPASSDRFEVHKRLLGPLRPVVKKVWRNVFPLPPPSLPEVPISGGFYEGLGCDVIHFAYQRFVLSSIPSIYNPHDLQHLHYPHYFSAATIAEREIFYRAGCSYSRLIVAGSEWIKQDLIHQYGIHSSKVQVIPWAPPTQAHEQPSASKVEQVCTKYDLVTAYALYPAMTWPHKNHVRLMQAIALLRDRHGARINLVCTGKQNEYWPEIERVVCELGLGDRVKFLGLLPMDELRAVYSAAQFVVIPTLFEAASGPLFEAWEDGVPAACSNVTSLPEQAADAALLFDPLSVEAIADALLKLSTDANLREALKKHGQRRLKDFSWERTAKAYRATYRMAAGVALTEEDRFLLNWDWMKDPKRTMEGQTV